MKNLNEIIKQLEIKGLIKGKDEKFEDIDDVIDYLLDIGATKAERGKFDEAGKYFDEVLKIKPGQADASYNKGRMEWDQKNYEKAIELFDLTIKNYPKFINAYTMKAECFEKLNKLDASLHCYEEIINIDPTSYNARKEKLRILKELDSQDALIEYQEESEIYEEMKDHYSEANKLRMDGKFQDAINNVDQYLDRYPNVPRAWIFKAETLCRMNKFEDAIACYDKAIFYHDPAVHRDLFLSDILTNKGLAYLSINNYEEAMKCQQRATELGPYSIKAWTNLGKTCLKLEKFEEAIDCFNKAVTIDPIHADIERYKAEAIDKLRKSENN